MYLIIFPLRYYVTYCDCTIDYVLELLKVGRSRTTAMAIAQYQS